MREKRGKESATEVKIRGGIETLKLSMPQTQKVRNKEGELRRNGGRTTSGEKRG